jgi:uncharacterized protein (TIGR02147 family)
MVVIAERVESMQPDIFSYMDYRLFLRDWYAHKKQINPHFSYRVLAQRVGFKSPGLVTQLLQGATNMSEALIVKFVKYMRLKKAEAGYFEALVRHNQAKTQEQRLHYLEKLIGSRIAMPGKIDKSKFGYFSAWYNVAVRELLNFYDCSVDPERISQMLIPSIKPAEVQKAIACLSDLGLITRDKEGRFRLERKLISTGEPVSDAVVAGYLRYFILLGLESVFRFPRSQREIASITCSVSADGYRKLCERVENFRSEILDIVSKDRNLDRVCQLNLQLFPLSHIVAKNCGDITQ